MWKRLKLSGKELIVIFVMIIIVYQIVNLGNKQLQLHFIDVGQGDSSLIITPSGKNILIDGGGSGTKDGFDVGKNTLLPYLLARKVKTIDYLIISHFDADHVRAGQ